MKKKNLPAEKRKQLKNKVYRSILDDETLISKVSDLDFSETYSYADYFRWKFEDRMELVRGKVFKLLSVSSTLHQQVCGLLYIKLCASLIPHGFEVFIAPFDVRLSNRSNADEDIYTVVQPDLCVICSPDKVDERGCIGSPDLIIEVLSEGNNRRELIEKFDVYEEAGVREYWIIHPIKKYFFLYYLNEKGKYQSAGKNLYGREVASVIFPNFKLNMQDLFRDKKEGKC